MVAAVAAAAAAAPPHTHNLQPLPSGAWGTVSVVVVIAVLVQLYVNLPSAETATWSRPLMR